MSENISTNVKTINIYIPRGDYRVIPISFFRNGTKKKLDEDDDIYLTACSLIDNSIKFQKTLSNGISFNEETMNYEIEINPEDTENLVLSQKYGYDIVVFYGKNKLPSQKVVGEISLSKKYSIIVIDEG